MAGLDEGGGTGSARRRGERRLRSMLRHEQVFFLGDDFAVFLRPFVSDSQLFGVRPWSTRLWIFLEDAFWTDPVFNTSWFASGCMYVSLRRLVQTAENWVSPQLQFTCGRRHPLRTAVADFHGPDYSGQPILEVLSHVLAASDLVGRLLRLVLRLVETLGALRRIAVITLAVAQFSSVLRHDRFLGLRLLHALACSRTLAGWWWGRKGAVDVGDVW